MESSVLRMTKHQALFLHTLNKLFAMVVSCSCRSYVTRSQTRWSLRPIRMEDIAEGEINYWRYSEQEREIILTEAQEKAGVHAQQQWRTILLDGYKKAREATVKLKLSTTLKMT